MSEPGGDGLLCGFWASGNAPAGLAWRLGADEGVITGRDLEGDGVASEAFGGAALTEADGTLAIGTEDEPGATLSPRDETPLETPSGAPAAGAPRAALCDASVRSAGNGKPKRGDGIVVRWADDPTAGAELFRALALPAPDGDVLLLTARREAGASNHADEPTTAWLLHPEGGATPFDEALLSTQYDADGNPTRVGLELWPAEGRPPLRAAATSFGLVAGDGVTAALMRSSAEGTEGTAAYLIRRP